MVEGAGRGAPASVAALTPLEVALARPLGVHLDSEARERWSGKASHPIEALKDILVEALSRPPCLVSFSGGRDSSALLALAARVSREAGLDLPIPATMYFPDETTDESSWQTLVMKELRLPDWLRLHNEPGQFDLVGPVAARVLTQHGLLWPFNAYFHLPIIERAAGGSVVTGAGGDEVASVSASSRAERVWARQEHLGPYRSARALSLALAPKWARKAYFGYRFDEQFPWLTSRGEKLARRALVRDAADAPFGFDRSIRWLWRSRYWQLALTSSAAVGSPYDVKIFHPLGDRRFLRALAATGGIPGYGRRADLVRRLFGDVLPEALVTRSSKATFTRQVFSSPSVAFARIWSGCGLSEELVRPEWLRASWLSRERNTFTALLLQQAWLHDHSA